MSEHTPPQGATTQPPGEILPAPDSSEQIFDGNVIRLRVSTYTRPSGLTVTREVLDHHGAVTMVPIEDDHILMVRQPREAAQEMMLELPAGNEAREVDTEGRMDRFRRRYGVKKK